MSGEWATTMAAALVGAGEPFFDDNAVHVELALVTPANVENDDPYIVWVDITDRVITARWNEGDTSGKESRWPIGSATIDCYDLVTELGVDFIAQDPDTRLSPGSLVRIAMTDDMDVVYRQWSGVIDAIQEVDKPGPRTWRIQAYDVLYPAAGEAPHGLGRDTVAGEQLDDLIDEVFNTNLGYRFAVDILPTTNTAGSFNIGGNLYGLAQRLADSYSCRLWANRAGFASVQLWDDVDVLNEDDVTDGNTVGLTGGVHANPLWVSSNARIASVLSATGLDIPAGPLPITTVVDFDLQTKNGNRMDAPGWPKGDLLYDTFGQGVDIVEDAAPRYASELELVRLDIDSAQNRDSTEVIPLLRTIGAGDGIRNFIPTKGGIGAYRVNLLILGAQHLIDRHHEFPRWQTSYFPKITGFEAI